MTKSALTSSVAGCGTALVLYKIQTSGRGAARIPHFILPTLVCLVILHLSTQPPKSCQPSIYSLDFFPFLSFFPPKDTATV